MANQVVSEIWVTGSASQVGVGIGDSEFQLGSCWKKLAIFVKWTWEPAKADSVLYYLASNIWFWIDRGFLR